MTSVKSTLHTDKKQKKNKKLFKTISKYMPNKQTKIYDQKSKS